MHCMGRGAKYSRRLKAITGYEAAALEALAKAIRMDIHGVLKDNNSTEAEPLSEPEFILSKPIAPSTIVFS